MLNFNTASYSLVIQCSKDRIDLTAVWKSEGEMGMKNIITMSQISMQLAMKTHAQMVLACFQDIFGWVSCLEIPKSKIKTAGFTLFSTWLQNTFKWSSMYCRLVKQKQFKITLLRKFACSHWKIMFWLDTPLISTRSLGLLSYHGQSKDISLHSAC